MFTTYLQILQKKKNYVHTYIHREGKKKEGKR